MGSLQGIYKGVLNSVGAGVKKERAKKKETYDRNLQVRTDT